MRILPRWNVRQHPVGGEVVNLVEEPPRTTDGRRRIILLIHGYNTSKIDAGEGYDRFVENLAGIGRAGTTIIPDVVEFYWPGDAWSKVRSTLDYPEALNRAAESARRLAEFVIHRPGAPPNDAVRYVLVAHSMGNRVALEFIGNMLQLAQPSGAVIRAACLMAAAVPVYMVENNGALRGAAASVEDTVAMYSPQDSVLECAFPVGQWGANEGWCEAVGLQGLPTERWRLLQRMHQGGAGFGHNDYWGSPKTARVVATLLGIVERRETPESLVSTRALPSTSEPDELHLASHRLTDRPTLG